MKDNFNNLKLIIHNIVNGENVITTFNDLLNATTDADVIIKNWVLAINKLEYLYNLNLILSDSNIHNLKLNNKFFYDVKDNTKTFEIRKNDRNFQVGDFINFYKFDKDNLNSKEDDIPSFTSKKISYILDSDDGKNYGLKEGYCILGINDYSSDWKLGYKNDAIIK